MAPPDRQPDHGAPARYGLDPGFAHGAEIAVWVDWLLHPEQHEYHRMYVWAAGIKEEYERRSKLTEQEEHVQTESVIQGLFVDQFFDPAQALSGQQVSESSIMDLVGSGLINASWQVEDWSARLAGGFEDVRKYWDNSAACTNAGDFLGAINTYAHKHAEITAEMAAVMLRYGSTIKAARKSLDEAMLKLVDAFHTKHYASDVPVGKILAAGISVIAATALGAVTAGTTTAVAVAASAGMSTLIDKLAGAALEEDVEKEVAEIKGETWRHTVDSFLWAQAEILRIAGEEIQAQTEALRGLRRRLAGLAPIPELTNYPC